MNYRVPPRFLAQESDDVIRRLTRIETRLCQLMLHLGADSAVHVARQDNTDDERIPSRANPLNTRTGNTGEWK